MGLRLGLGLGLALGLGVEVGVRVRVRVRAYEGGLLQRPRLHRPHVALLEKHHTLGS